MVNVTKNKVKISDLFHENTKIYKFDEQPQEYEIPIWWNKIHFKAYPRMKKVNLVFPHTKSYLEKIIETRRSVREFNCKQLNIKILSRILFFSAGINKKESDEWNGTLRAYPSAGARYPLEIYIVVFRCKGLKKGLYHYNIKNNQLERLLEGNFLNYFINNTNQKWLSRSSVLIVITSVSERTEIKYGVRGYRYQAFEAGHLAQNIYLLSTENGIGCCAIGGFIDDELITFLDLDKGEKPFYLLGLGIYDKKM